MKMKAIVETLEAVKKSPSYQSQLVGLLLGIYELLIVIANNMGVFEEDEEDPE